MQRCGPRCVVQSTSAPTRFGEHLSTCGTNLLFALLAAGHERCQPHGEPNKPRYCGSNQLVSGLPLIGIKPLCTWRPRNIHQHLLA